jgi:hypothetical protein
VSQLEPDELSRLLRAAVDPIRPSPEGYQLIRAGIERRARWRVPTLAAAGVTMVALIALAVVALRPIAPDQTVEPQPPIASISAGSQPVTTGGPNQSDGYGNGASSGSGGSAHRSGPPSTAPSTPPAGTGSPLPRASSSGANSPTRPTAVARPAKPGDLDGDGTVDQVRVSGMTLQVGLSRGQTAQVQLPDGSSPTTSAGFDVDADGYSELLVQTGSANGTDTYGVVRYVTAGQLAMVSDAAPAVRLTAGQAYGVLDYSGAGFHCLDNGTVQLFTGRSTDSGLTYTVTTTTARLTDQGLMAQAGTPTASTVDAAAAIALFTARCGALS